MGCEAVNCCGKLSVKVQLVQCCMVSLLSIFILYIVISLALFSSTDNAFYRLAERSFEELMFFSIPFVYAVRLFLVFIQYGCSLCLCNRVIPCVYAVGLFPVFMQYGCFLCYAVWLFPLFML